MVAKKCSGRDDLKHPQLPHRLPNSDQPSPRRFLTSAPGGFTTATPFLSVLYSLVARTLLPFCDQRLSFCLAVLLSDSSCWCLTVRPAGLFFSFFTLVCFGSARVQFTASASIPNCVRFWSFRTGRVAFSLDKYREVSIGVSGFFLLSVLLAFVTLRRCPF